jgi:hypothetical protein
VGRIAARILRAETIATMLQNQIRNIQPERQPMIGRVCLSREMQGFGPVLALPRNRQKKSRMLLEHSWAAKNKTPQAQGIRGLLLLR